MVKVISLSNEAYERLKALKREDKSFSEVVIEITPKIKKKTLKDFYGIWKDDGEWDKIVKTLKEDRKKFKLGDYKW